MRAHGRPGRAEVDQHVAAIVAFHDVGRLDRLVFLQQLDAYKVGAAIDTHPGWEKRTEKLILAGADMIFIDTSDADKPFSTELVEKYVISNQLEPYHRFY